MDNLTNQLNCLGESGGSGDRKESVAADLLLPLVYEELRRLAAQKMATEPAGHTLQATALVHEAWLRVGGARQSWENRAHFYGAAAEAMRRILIEAARRKRAARHGGNLERISADAIEIEAPIAEDKLMALNEALDRLEEHDARKAQLVKLRYFTGLTVEATAEVLGISKQTAKRDWSYSRAWMFRWIKEDAMDMDDLGDGQGDGGTSSAEDSVSAPPWNKDKAAADGSGRET
jgi:RNA polymerase sigma factor (TIGR02999 family)